MADYLCPCGSGKSYRNCCGIREKVIFLEQYRWRRAGQELRRKLGEFADSQCFAQEVVKAQEKYLNCLDPELVDRDDEFTMERCFEWFIFDYVLPDGLTIIETFRQNPDLSEREQALLADWAAARISLYEVLKVLPRKGVVLRDLLQKRELKVHDINAAAELQPGTILLMRVLKVGDEYEFSTSGLALPGFCKDVLLKKLRRDLRFYARKRNAPTRQVLSDYLRDRSHIINAIVVEMGFNYTLPHLVDDSEGDEYFPPVNDALFDRISARIAQQITEAVLDEYYDRWIDKPVPALDGKTPREACRTAEGRARLEELFRELELVETSRELKGEPHYDLQKLRRKLGLLPAGGNAEEGSREQENFKKPEDYQWPTVTHADVARGVMEDLRVRGYGPGQVQGALHLWHDYCSKVQPSFRKPELWVATVVYAMARLECDHRISQHELARQYGVAPSSISANFRAMCRALDLVVFDKRYSTRKSPLAGLKEADPLLAQILENLKL
ncbi:SEC-C metal-binding domain-containing protein [Desulfofundulus salinus]|uniref:SEC-C domain-containing protein n=1 Tax=Desulfofundulus salinus TaxID=2419843 RepID=A0A494X0C8_9FIRM|nr:SEC-C metal-binding domain-containing protein [Desulfofundulus salinum]RKO68052.1 SEC-C domain-containing protein [Desulfofundulus salinum]